MQNDNAFFENACGMSSIQMLIETLVHPPQPPPPPPLLFPITKEKSCEYCIYYFLIYKMVFVLQSSKMLNEWKVIFP